MLELASFYARLVGEVLLCSGCFLLRFIDNLLAKLRYMLRASNFIDCRLGLWPESFFCLSQRRYNVLALL